MSLADVQRRLAAAGFDAGAADGVYGRRTDGAIVALLDAYGALLDAYGALLADLEASPAGARIVPADWMPDVPMSRIIVHWTAGRHAASALDRQHYHLVIDGEPTLVRGTPTIDLNSGSSVKPGYAAHTLNCNTGSIGVALCGMAGAVERPFDPGDWPITREQWDKLALVCADLCQRYRIRPAPTTLLSHAEVQDTLGIAQRGKWDIAALPFLPGAPQGARAVGDMLRARVAALLSA